MFSGVIDFFDTLTSEQTWLRVFYVVFGAALVWYSLMQDTAKMNIFWG